MATDAIPDGSLGLKAAVFRLQALGLLSTLFLLVRPIIPGRRFPLAGKGMCSDRLRDQQITRPLSLLVRRLTVDELSSMLMC